MSLEPFPAEVRRFLDGNIETIDQLEILRVLGEAPDQDWTPALLAHAVQAAPTVVATHVAALWDRGLITAERRGTDLVCRHGARTPELERLVSKLLQLYRERPVTMIKLVYERARDPLRTFADAFRIRKEGD